MNKNKNENNMRNKLKIKLKRKTGSFQNLIGWDQYSGGKWWDQYIFNLSSEKLFIHLFLDSTLPFFSIYSLKKHLIPWWTYQKSSKKNFP